MKRSPSGGGGSATTDCSALREPVLPQLLVERRLADLETTRQLGAGQVGIDSKRLLEPTPLGILEKRRQPGREITPVAGDRRCVALAVEETEQLRRLDRSVAATHRESRRELLEVPHVPRPCEVELDQRALGLGREPHPAPGLVLVERVAQQERQVLEPLAQRR